MTTRPDRVAHAARRRTRRRGRTILTAAVLTPALAFGLGACAPAGDQLEAYMHASVVEIAERSAEGDYAGALAELALLERDVTRAAGDGRIGREREQEIRVAMDLVRADLEAAGAATTPPPPTTSPLPGTEPEPTNAPVPTPEGSTTPEPTTAPEPTPTPDPTPTPEPTTTPEPLTTPEPPLTPVPSATPGDDSGTGSSTDDEE